MRSGEVARLLTLAAAVDNRNLEGVQGEAAVAAWLQVLGDLPYEACVHAIGEHRRTAPGIYLEPGHIVAIVEAAAPADALGAERAALEDFAAFTGVPLAAAAERWNDEAWKSARVDEARKAHQQRALEGGTDA